MFGMGPIEVLFAGAFLIPVAVAVVLAARFVRANERRPVGGDHTRLEERIARLEDTIDQMSQQLERVAEGQRFTTQLLAERDKSRDPA